MSEAEKLLENLEQEERFKDIVQGLKLLLQEIKISNKEMKLFTKCLQNVNKQDTTDDKFAELLKAVVKLPDKIRLKIPDKIEAVLKDNVLKPKITLPTLPKNLEVKKPKWWNPAEIAKATVSLMKQRGKEMPVRVTNKVLGAASRSRELILKRNTIYNLRLIANAAGYVNYDLEWYEHTPKN